MHPSDPTPGKNLVDTGHTPIWGTKRANFGLPDFTRQIWVSEQARGVWQARILRIGKIWREIECFSVASNVRSCALAWFSQQELVRWSRDLSKYGLKTVVLAARLTTIPGNSEHAKQCDRKELLFRVAIGLRADMAAFKDAWAHGDDERIGQLLGYPSCCRRFFREVFVEQGYVDGDWPAAWNTATPFADTRLIVFGGPPQLNIFWRSVRLKIIPHFPCRF
ncbi:MAG TPA: hypothetical protein VJX67_25215, partial [Blastocatellia bacterium]|nr:hypothetical protein [Blastocatellia bacterium]